MAVSSFTELLFHAEHEVEVACYGPAGDPVNVAVECLTCGTVLLDFDKEDDE